MYHRAMRLKFLTLMLIISCTAAPCVLAENADTTVSETQTDTSLLSKATTHIKTIWNEGGIQMMLPFYTWHMPWRYTSEKRKDYNNYPWGIGLGKYLEPTPDRRYGLMALTFQDSFNKPEPSVWYSWQALWRDGKDFRPSLGFVAGITCRDNYNWIPIPAAAPTVGFDYKSMSVEALYVPGFDVLFAWMSWRF